MSDLRIGVIGACRRGEFVDAAHRPGNGSRIVAGADIFPDALQEFDQRLGGGMRLYTDYRELVADSQVDAVFITAPDFLHEEMAVAALQAGKIVYLEKPMAITIAGCDRILEAAYHNKSRLFLGHNMRYFPAIIKMKELLDSGIIGDIQAVWERHFIDYGGDAYFKDWHSERRYAGGLLLQKGAHDIDVIHYLCNSYCTRVNGMGKLSVYDKCPRRDFERTKRFVSTTTGSTWPPLSQTEISPVVDVEDHSMIFMQLANGVQAAYLQCHYTPDEERNFTFIGTRGRLENFGYHGACRIQVWTTRSPRTEPDMVYHIKPVPGTHGGSDRAIIDGFLDFAIRGKKPATSAIAARNAVAVGVLGHESMRGDGAYRSIPPVPDHLIRYFEH